MPQASRKNAASPVLDLIASTSLGANPRLVFFYAAATIAAFSAVAYELLLASYATFLLGATVFQYSLVISLMMASMGFGALLTGKLEERALVTFFAVELGLALIAIVALPILYTAFAWEISPRFFILLFVLAIGTAIGMEIPLLNFLNKSKDSLPKILFFDYLGGFVGGIAFPLWLLPHLGFFRLAAALGTLNAVLAACLLWLFWDKFKSHRVWWTAAVAGVLVLSLAFLVGAESFRHYLELRHFQIKPL